VILVCGETLIDLTPSSGGSGAYVPHPGGGPCNTAVALGRLEVPVAFLGRLSSDPFGQRLRRHLVDNGVDPRYIVDASEPTTLALVGMSGSGQATYSFYVEGTADRGLRQSHLPTPLPDEVAALHLGSLAIVLEPGASTLEHLVERERGRRVVSLDPNVRPAIISDSDAYRQRLERLVCMADVVRVSRDDLAWVEPADPATIARRWLAAGAALVVVTSGDEGATAYNASDEVSVLAEPVRLVDTIGAGDAFNAGLLGWLHETGELRRDRIEALGSGEIAEALRFAGRVAALTCARAGADPPHLAELNITRRSRGDRQDRG
jgi:fructokinase